MCRRGKEEDECAAAGLPAIRTGRGPTLGSLRVVKSKLITPDSSDDPLSTKFGLPFRDIIREVEAIPLTPSGHRDTMSFQKQIERELRDLSFEVLRDDFVPSKLEALREKIARLSRLTSRTKRKIAQALDELTKKDEGVFPAFLTRINDKNYAVPIVAPSIFAGPAVSMSRNLGVDRAKLKAIAEFCIFADHFLAAILDKTAINNNIILNLYVRCCFEEENPVSLWYHLSRASRGSVWFGTTAGNAVIQPLEAIKFQLEQLAPRVCRVDNARRFVNAGLQWRGEGQGRVESVTPKDGGGGGGDSTARCGTTTLIYGHSVGMGPGGK